MLSLEEIDELASDDRFLFARAVERATIERCAKVCEAESRRLSADAWFAEAHQIGEVVLLIRDMLEEKP